jgi:hypothetical protein
MRKIQITTIGVLALIALVVSPAAVAAAGNGRRKRENLNKDSKPSAQPSASQVLQDLVGQYNAIESARQEAVQTFENCSTWTNPQQQQLPRAVQDAMQYHLKEAKQEPDSVDLLLPYIDGYEPMSMRGADETEADAKVALDKLRTLLKKQKQEQQRQQKPTTGPETICQVVQRRITTLHTLYKDLAQKLVNITSSVTKHMPQHWRMFIDLLTVKCADRLGVLQAQLLPGCL